MHLSTEVQIFFNHFKIYTYTQVVKIPRYRCTYLVLLRKLIKYYQEFHSLGTYLIRIKLIRSFNID